MKITEIRTVYLTVKGVAPRCRKVDRHLIKMGTHGVDADPQSFMPEARAELAKFKSVESAELHLDIGTIEESDDGFKSQKHLLMDPRHIRIKIA